MCFWRLLVRERSDIDYRRRIGRRGQWAVLGGRGGVGNRKCLHPLPSGFKPLAAVHQDRWYGKRGCCRRIFDELDGNNTGFLGAYHLGGERDGKRHSVLLY